MTICILFMASVHAMREDGQTLSRKITQFRHPDPRANVHSVNWEKLPSARRNSGRLRSNNEWVYKKLLHIIYHKDMNITSTRCNVYKAFCFTRHNPGRVELCYIMLEKNRQDLQLLNHVFGMKETTCKNDS